MAKKMCPKRRALIKENKEQGHKQGIENYNLFMFKSLNKKTEGVKNVHAK